MPTDKDGSWYPLLFDRQVEVFNSRSRALLVCGPRKSGKCVDGETIIQAGDHLRRMRRMGPAIEKGDFVLSSEPIIAFDKNVGCFTKTHTSGFYRDKETIGLQFICKGGYSVTTSMIHPLWSRVDGVDDYRQACELSALLKQNVAVSLPVVLGFDTWSSSVYETVEFLPHDKKKQKRYVRNARIRRAMQSVPHGRIYEIARLAKTTYHTVKAFLSAPNDVSLSKATIDEDMGYLLGALIGDGCMTKASMAKFRVLFATTDNETLDSVKHALVKHFPLARISHLESCNWQILSPELRGLLIALGVDCYAHEKRIPDVLIQSPKSVVRSLLQGLFDTDGTVDRNGRVSFCSTSESLARDVQQLLLAFGIASTLRSKRTTGRLAFIVELYGDSESFFERIGFRIERKQHRRTLLSKERRKRHREVSGLNGKVLWRPVLSCDERNADLYDVAVPVFHNFVGNGFINHNTWAVLHRIVRHLWETPGARVAMFAKTMKTAKDAGTWADLHSITLPEWIKADIGLQYTTTNSEGLPGFKTDGQTRTPYFRIRNYHGGESELRLFSLDYDDGIEDKIKEQRFSLIYFSELSKFLSRKVLSMPVLQLRMPHLRMEDQMWIADTNPGEEGESSWIYEVWYKERTMPYEKYCEYCKERHRIAMPKETFDAFKAGLELIEIRPEENPYLDPRELEELKSTYAYDEGLYARYVDGKWVYGDGDHSRHFRKLYKPHIHNVGDCSSKVKADWIYANPSELCFELGTGWDLGDVNHGAVAVEKMQVNNKSHFVVLDELEVIGEEVSIEDFTREFLDIIEGLDKIAGRTLITETCWSDRSSIEKYSATGDTYPYLQVFSASEERFFLNGVPKGKGSRVVRVQLLKALLAQGRIKFSAHCTGCHRMLRDLKKGKDRLHYVVEDENKHLFDALTYYLLMEMSDELETGKNRTAGKRQPLNVAA